VALHPRQTERATAKLQEEEDGLTLVRELRLVSSGTLSRAGPEEDAIIILIPIFVIMFIFMHILFAKKNP